MPKYNCLLILRRLLIFKKPTGEGPGGAFLEGKTGNQKNTTQSKKKLASMAGTRSNIPPQGSPTLQNEYELWLNLRCLSFVKKN